MGENLFCENLKSVSNDYVEGWYRTYVGYPDMNDMVKNMLTEYVGNGDVTKIFLFFSETCGFSEHYSSFLMREVMRGNIK